MCPPRWGPQIGGMDKAKTQYLKILEGPGINIRLSIKTDNCHISSRDDLVMNRFKVSKRVPYISLQLAMQLTPSKAKTPIPNLATFFTTSGDVSAFVSPKQAQLVARQ
mmetsp:Transcript_46838/g.77269  ORF Transcript_46838/g.77269 Transcript_46838/m.77269 type:complete len:108 (-) Transcript_46838:332-655(-)